MIVVFVASEMMFTIILCHKLISDTSNTRYSGLL